MRKPDLCSVTFSDGTQLIIETVPGGWVVAAVIDGSSFQARIDESTPKGVPAPPRSTLLENLVVSFRSPRDEPKDRFGKHDTGRIWKRSLRGPSTKLLEARVVTFQQLPR